MSRLERSQTTRDAREGVSEVLDSRNDEEQQRKFAEILDILLAAGACTRSPSFAGARDRLRVSVHGEKC
jgi:hypothetical protein